MEGIKTSLSDKEADAMLSVAYATMPSENVAVLENYINGLRNDSRTCSLTGMKNRRAWSEDFEGELDSLSRGNSEVHSLFYFDLDKFKDVNDTYGHAAGDEVLKTVGAVVLENIRDCDSAYRIGGEEFLILFRDTPIAQAIKPSLKLDKAIYDNKVIVRDEGNVHTFYDTRLSGGLIEIGQNHEAVGLYRGGNIESAVGMVVGESDDLMYHVKENGRDNIARRSESKIILLKD